MRVSRPFVAGVLLSCGIVACLVWLYNAFHGAGFSSYGSPDDGCITVPEGVRSELDRRSDRPLNALLVATTGSALAFGIAARNRPPRRAERRTLVILIFAGAAGSLLSRPMFAADDFTALALFGVGAAAAFGSWFALRHSGAYREGAAPSGPPAAPWSSFLAAAYLVVLPLIVLAISQTGETAICT